jgi:pyridoxal phosphate enzyme (YggS family)
MGIADALKKVEENIANAARRAGRDPAGVKLVAVSKTVGPDRIAEAAEAGARFFGENRVQEARQKISNVKCQISNLPVEWHLIGSLQKNKAKTAVLLFDVIQSLDSYDLARVLDRYAEQIGKKQRVFVQVKLSMEESKHGAYEKDVFELLEKVLSMEHLRAEGLMAIPPYFENPEKARPYFRRLRQIRDRAALQGFQLPELSMGMSNDYEIAVDEGATFVRVGTAIFGERSYK